MSLVTVSSTANLNAAGTDISTAWDEQNEKTVHSGEEFLSFHIYSYLTVEVPDPLKMSLAGTSGILDHGKV